MRRRWHRPGPFAIALTLAGCLLFLGLGFWQLRRADEKIALFAAFDALATQEPITLDAARRNPRTAPQRVRVVGRYDSSHAWLLDNQIRDGRAGVMVFDLFEPADGSTPLLANRGFLPRDAAARIPALPPPPAGPQQLLALYAPPPASGLRLGGNRLPRQHVWPKLGIYIDPAEIGADLGRRIDARVLLLLPQEGSPFVREWQPDTFPPERHQAYALTWFLFAALCWLLFVLRHWREDGTRNA